MNQHPEHRWNRRVFYIALALGTIALGLGVHYAGSALGRVTRDVLGDALWAALMMWLVSAAAPNARLGLRSAVALGICFVVELSQLLQGPTLDELRRTTLGQLTLGSGFDSRDLAAYAVGVLVAAMLERAALRRSLLPARS